MVPARPHGGLWKLLWVLPLCRGVCVHLPITASRIAS